MPDAVRPGAGTRVTGAGCDTGVTAGTAAVRDRPRRLTGRYDGVMTATAATGVPLPAVPTLEAWVMKWN